MKIRVLLFVVAITLIFSTSFTVSALSGSSNAVLPLDSDTFSSTEKLCSRETAVIKPIADFALSIGTIPKTTVVDNTEKYSAFPPPCTANSCGAGAICQKTCASYCSDSVYCDPLSCTFECVSYDENDDDE